MVLIFKLSCENCGKTYSTLAKKSSEINIECSNCRKVDLTIKEEPLKPSLNTRQGVE